MQIGRRDRYLQHLRDLIDEAEEKTFNNNGPVLQLALDYGRRDEIERALSRIDIVKRKGFLPPNINVDFDLIKTFSDNKRKAL